MNDLAFRGSTVEATKQADQSAKHQETKQAEGDELQVSCDGRIQPT